MKYILAKSKKIYNLHIVGCSNGESEEDRKFCDDLKEKDACNDEMLAKVAMEKCPLNCGCGKL